MLEAGNFEGLGWNVEGANHLDPRVRLDNRGRYPKFVRGGGPTSGDELTYLVSKRGENLRITPLLVIIFSDVEVAAVINALRAERTGNLADRATHR